LHSFNESREITTIWFAFEVPIEKPTVICISAFDKYAIIQRDEPKQADREFKKWSSRPWSALNN